MNEATPTVHQQGNGILLDSIGVDRIAIVGQHVVPIIMRETEVGTLGGVVVVDGIFVTSLAMRRPLVIIHHLSYSCCYSSAVGIARKAVERMLLSPSALEQRCNGLCE